MTTPATAARPATLASVAASAGVSIATASKVLNGRGDVSPRTRARVQDQLQRHNYVARRTRGPARPPGAVDRASIQVIFQGDLNAYGVEILQGVLAAGAEAGVVVVVSQHQHEEAGLTASWAQELAAAGRRAVITVVEDLTPEVIAALASAGVPLVVIDALNMPDTRLTSVGSTNFAGGVAATRHLLDLGHRRIAYLGGPASAACNLARLHGYRAAMEAAGVPVPDGFIRYGHFRYADGTADGAAVLGLPEPPTAVFAGCDETAAGVIEAARALGLKVPRDLSVVGFDDTQLASLSSPRLTTIRQPLRGMGRVAVGNALRLAAGETLDANHVELATTLIVRESTAAPVRATSGRPPTPG